MRRALAGVAMLAGLGACAPEAPQGCAASVTREVAFSGAQMSQSAGPDTVVATSTGADCASAVFTLAINAPDGAPIWAVATPAAWLYPELAASELGPPSPDAITGALERWANLSIATTASQPAWGQDARAPGAPTADEALAAGLDEAADGHAGPWRTPLDPLTYRDVRARALPMACIALSPDSAQCVYWEPALGHAALFVTFQR